MNDDLDTRILPADLLTPVGAYLRVRAARAAGVPARVGRARPAGRPLLVPGRRLPAVDSLDEPRPRSRASRARARPPGLPPFWAAWSATSPTTGSPRSSRCRCRRATRRCRPAAVRFLLAPTSVAFDHVRRTMTVTGPRAEVRAGHGRARRSPPRRPPAEPCRGRRRGSRDDAAPTNRGRRAGARSTSPPATRSRSCPRSASRRPTAATPFAHLPRAARRQPVAVHVPARPRRPPDRIGASPETHVSLSRDGIASCRPIAGTRPRGADARRRRRARGRAEADEKERAEHLMLVDLARNDLGRVCEPGTVRSRELLEVERYSHVMHLVSHVSAGSPARGEDALSLLRATFPAGTVSRRAEGARDADHLRARGPPPRRLRGRGRLRRLRRRAWTRASPCARS